MDDLTHVVTQPDRAEGNVMSPHSEFASVITRLTRWVVASTSVSKGSVPITKTRSPSAATEHGSPSIGMRAVSLSPSCSNATSSLPVTT